MMVGAGIRQSTPVPEGGHRHRDAGAGRDPDVKLRGKEDIYFGPREQQVLLASAPDSKINLTLDYARGRFASSLRFVRDIFDVYPTQQDTETETGGLWDAVQMGFSGA